MSLNPLSVLVEAVNGSAFLPEGGVHTTTEFGPHVVLTISGLFFAVVGGGLIAHAGRRLCRRKTDDSCSSVAIGVLSGGCLVFSGLGTIVAHELGMEKVYAPLVSVGATLSGSVVGVYNAWKGSTQSDEREPLV